MLRHKPWIIAIWLTSLASCVYFYTSSQKELAPNEDQGWFQVIATAPKSIPPAMLEEESKVLNTIYQPFSEISSYVYINGIPESNQILSFISLKPWEKRKLSAMRLQPKLQDALNNLINLKAFSFLPPSLSEPGSGPPIQFVLKSIGNYKNLYEAAQTLEQAARQSGLFQFINDDLSYDQPVLHINIDRNAAAAMNVKMDAITQSISYLHSSGYSQYFNLQGQTYQVVIQALMPKIVNPDVLNQIQVRSDSGKLIPLSALTTLTTAVEPSSLNQFQRMNAVTLSGAMAPGQSTSAGLTFLSQKTKALLPNNLVSDLSGASRQYRQEGDRMLWLFLASFIAIFIVLAMQFESFRDPFIILLGSVPMAVMAALVPAKLNIVTINLYTQIGLLTLAGLISKHSIMLVKFANTLQMQNADKTTAIIEAAQIRLRPILMTTLAIVFGGLPLIFSAGAGSVARFDMGIVIALGMFVGTCFTLFVTPVLYLLFATKRD